MKLFGIFLLLLNAIISGTSLVVRLQGMEHLGSFSYSASRYLFAFASLLVVLFFTRKSRARERQEKNYRHGYGIGLIIGITLFLASITTQIALQYTTAGKASFITSLYIVFVPFGAKFLEKLFI